LIYKKFVDVSEIISLSSDEFAPLHFDQKIEVLHGYLPQLLVDNKNLYGIVSKGIHELSEEECLTMFPCIRTGIELKLLLATQRKSCKKNQNRRTAAWTTVEK
jgi:hypothetical protein